MQKTCLFYFPFFLQRYGFLRCVCVFPLLPSPPHTPPPTLFLHRVRLLFCNKRSRHSSTLCEMRNTTVLVQVAFYLIKLVFYFISRWLSTRGSESSCKLFPLFSVPASPEAFAHNTPFSDEMCYSHSILTFGAPMPEFYSFFHFSKSFFV